MAASTAAAASESPFFSGTGGDDDGDDVIAAANNETPDYQSHFFHACAHTLHGDRSGCTLGVVDLQTKVVF